MRSDLKPWRFEADVEHVGVVPTGSDAVLVPDADGKINSRDFCHGVFTIKGKRTLKRSKERNVSTVFFRMISRTTFLIDWKVQHVHSLFNKALMLN